jgi:signal transduction histidine kinase
VTADPHIIASPAPHSAWYAEAMEKLVAVVQALSATRTLESLMAVVRTAARELTGADGATFVLRDGGNCYYADEDAISPLWKGKRFPLNTCISGWVMLHAEPAVIEDIYADPRIPAAAYRPTFVKSLAMVPIRKAQPIGAIGNYWARNRLPAGEEVAVLEALANVTAVQLENVGLYAQLQEKLRALEETNQELRQFAWIASHDLKSPLRGISHLSQWAEEDADGPLPEKTREHLQVLRLRVSRMDKMLDDLLDYTQIEGKRTIDDELADGETILTAVRELMALPAGFTLKVTGDFSSLRLPRFALERVFANLIDNAVKHHDRGKGVVEVSLTGDEGYYVISVTDDGPGIAQADQKKIFEPFTTLKPRDRAEGSGMGLAIAKRLLARYGRALEVSSQGRGCTFSFTWPKPLETPQVSKKTAS